MLVAQFEVLVRFERGGLIPFPLHENDTGLLSGGGGKMGGTKGEHVSQGIAGDEKGSCQHGRCVHRLDGDTGGTKLRIELSGSVIADVSAIRGLVAVCNEDPSVLFANSGACEGIMEQFGELQLFATIVIDGNVAVGRGDAGAIEADSLDAAGEHIIRRFIHVAAAIIVRAASYVSRALIGVGAGICYAFPVRHAGNGGIAIKADTIRTAPVTRAIVGIGTLTVTAVHAGTDGGGGAEGRGGSAGRGSDPNGRILIGGRGRVRPACDAMARA